MRSSPRPAPYATSFLLLTYLLLSAVPFVPNLLGKPIDHPWQVALIEALAWALAWSAFKRPAWFHWLLLPAFLALPTEVYLFTFYGQGISTHHLGIIAETSPREAMEFLGGKVWLMGGVMLGVIVWWGVGYWAALRARALDWHGRTRWIALALLLVLIALWAYGYEFGIRAKPASAPHAAAHAAPSLASASASTSASDGSVAASGFGD